MEKRKKASCLKKQYGKINYYMLFIFSKGGGRGQHHFSAQHFNRGGGPGTHNFSMGQFLWNPIPHVIFQWGPTPCSIGIRPCPESRQCLDLFVFYSLRPSQRYFSYVGTVLPVLNKYLARINVSCSRTQYNDTDEARTLGPSVSSEVKHSTTEPLRSRSCLEGYGSREPIGISLSILIFRALLVQPM